MAPQNSEDTRITKLESAVASLSANFERFIEDSQKDRREMRDEIRHIAASRNWSMPTLLTVVGLIGSALFAIHNGAKNTSTDVGQLEQTQGYLVEAVREVRDLTFDMRVSQGTIADRSAENAHELDRIWDLLLDPQAGVMTRQAKSEVERKIHFEWLTELTSHQKEDLEFRGGAASKLDNFQRWLEDVDSVGSRRWIPEYEVEGAK